MIVAPDALVVIDHVYGEVPLEAVKVCVPAVAREADVGEIVGVESAAATCSVRSGAGLEVLEVDVEAGVPPHAATTTHKTKSQMRTA